MRGPEGLPDSGLPLTRACCATPANANSPMTAWTPARCRPASDTRISRLRCATPNSPRRGLMCSGRTEAALVVYATRNLSGLIAAHFGLRRRKRLRARHARTGIGDRCQPIFRQLALETTHRLCSQTCPKCPIFSQLEPGRQIPMFLRTYWIGSEGCRDTRNAPSDRCWL